MVDDHAGTFQPGLTPMAAVWKHRRVGSIGPSHNQHNAARPTEDGEIRRPWAFLLLGLLLLVTVKGGYVPIVKTRNIVYGELLAWGFTFRDFLSVLATRAKRA